MRDYDSDTKVAGVRIAINVTYPFFYSPKPHNCTTESSERVSCCECIILDCSISGEERRERGRERGEREMDLLNEYYTDSHANEVLSSFLSSSLPEFDKCHASLEKPVA